MAYRCPLATWFFALALSVAPRAAAQSPPTSRPTNPLREPAPVEALEASEFSLPPPVEDSPALQYASAAEKEFAPPEAELLPKPTGPRWQGEPPRWVGRGAAAPLTGSELVPDALPPGMLPPASPALSEPLSEAYAPAFKAPLMRESWMFRPYHIDGFMGTLLVANPLPDRVKAGSAFYIGFRLGWDVSKNFGLESNFGFAKVGNSYPQLPTKMGDEKLFLWDIDCLWYPWGDTRLRPYLLIGTGLNDVNFVNELDQQLHSTLFNLPWGGGVKYRLGNRVAFRFDIRDNVTYGAGNGTSLMHNLAITFNIEWHFGGGARRSYWPWNPSRVWW
ncbi:MAG TPA: outer membrane beta-barrel protein [Pirellulales bacterium]|nr:outer membrane beta-barrel protein [Pirellulales bacterium]